MSMQINEPMQYVPASSLERLVAVQYAATALFELHAEKDAKWYALGVALYGMDDPRVKALEPKYDRKILPGAWVVDPSGETGYVIAYDEQCKNRINVQHVIEGRFGSKIWWNKSVLRVATPEEIARARGEAVEEKYSISHDLNVAHEWYVNKGKDVVATCKGQAKAQLVCDALNGRET